MNTFSHATLYASAGTSYDPVVCLSVTSRCSLQRDGRINLLLGMEGSFDQCQLGTRKVDAHNVINWTVLVKWVDTTSELRRSTTVVIA